MKTILNQDELVSILNKMDIPSLRRNLTPDNIRWLLRNIQIKNTHEKMLDIICTLKSMI